MNSDDISPEDIYDKELDLCLDLVSESNNEQILSRIFELNSGTWFNLRNDILERIELIEISEKINVMWLFLPQSNIQDMVIILFLNPESLDMNYCYYNVSLLNKSKTLK